MSNFLKTPNLISSVSVPMVTFDWSTSFSMFSSVHFNILVKLIQLSGSSQFVFSCGDLGRRQWRGYLFFIICIWFLFYFAFSCFDHSSKSMDLFCYFLFLILIGPFIFLHTSVFCCFSYEHKLFLYTEGYVLIIICFYDAFFYFEIIKELLTQPERSLTLLPISFIFVLIVINHTILLMGIFSNYILTLIEKWLTVYLPLLGCILSITY